MSRHRILAVLAAAVAFGWAAPARAQVFKLPKARDEPAYWVSADVGLFQSGDVVDGTTQSTWHVANPAFQAIPAYTLNAVLADKQKLTTILTHHVIQGRLTPDKLAGEHTTLAGDKVTIAKLNIDENPHVPTKYGVRGIPTMMIFHQGQVAATKVGALPKSKIKEWIESSI